jgi:hypothetical protein
MTLNTAMSLFSLVFAIWFTLVNLAKFQRGYPISTSNFVMQSVAIVGFIYFQGWIK